MDALTIQGLQLSELRRIEHPKGDVLHALKRSAPGFVGFGEAYFSVVKLGAIKGWKRHNRVTLNLVVPVGAVRFVVYDDRPGLSSGERFADITLGTPRYARLTVPPGLWMAFQGRVADESLLLNITDHEHDPTESDAADLETFPYAW